MPDAPHGPFDPPTLDEMLDLLPAADVARRLAAVRPKGEDKLIGRCPAHRERTPSFVVRGVGGPGRSQRVRCYGCGFRGDVLDLVAVHEGRTREDVLADLPQRLGLAPADPAPGRDPAAGIHPDLIDDF